MLTAECASRNFRRQFVSKDFLPACAAGHRN
jgi:hypothetical protein